MASAPPPRTDVPGAIYDRRAHYEPPGPPLGYAYQSPHIGHQNHLCYMCTMGVCSLEDVKKLVNKPQFVCRTCGRAANSADNLCDPEPLE